MRYSSWRTKDYTRCTFLHLLYFAFAYYAMHTPHVVAGKLHSKTAALTYEHLRVGRMPAQGSIISRLERYK